MGAEKHELASLIDLDRVQRLCESISEAFGFALAVLDLRGEVLIATGWQDICTRFHRENPETLQGCLESDLRINQRLVEGLDRSEHYAYRCSNGLWDVAFPLVIAGEHLANVYTGQFFFDDDRVDREEFAARARRLGFDEASYVAALDRVPVVSQEDLRRTITFVSDFVGMLGEMGMNVTELRQAEEALRLQEEGIRRAYVDVLDAVTGGKLILLTEKELHAELGEPLSDPVPFRTPAELAAARRMLVRTAEAGFPGRVRHTDVLSTVGEALDNAIKHGGGGTYQAFARDGSLQVAVADEGPGIDFRTLPRATLQRGFSTASSLGMGFTIMLQVCERVLLSTHPGRTTVVLEFGCGKPEESGPEVVDQLDVQAS